MKELSTTRRDFLKTTAAAGAIGIVLAGPKLLPAGAFETIKIDSSRFCDGGTIHKAFIEPGKKNYWPGPDSVLINQANMDFAPNLDFNHTQRKPPFDVGAYESEGNAKNPGWQIQSGFKVTR